MPMTRLGTISAALICGPVMTAAIAQPPDPAKPAEKVQTLSVRVVDTRGQGVPDVEFKVVDRDSTAEGRRYRTGADGRVRVAVDPHFRRLAFEARPDDRTLGWASLEKGRLWPTATNDDPVRLMLLPRDHQVEGSVVDARGKPIPGVRIRVVSLQHEANGAIVNDGSDPDHSAIGPAVTDDAGRFRLNLPRDASARLQANHPRYAGPIFSARADARTIEPVALEDTGGIAGTVIDAASGRAVEAARVSAQAIERYTLLRGGGGLAISDARGRFQIGGLAPGVYNLLLDGTPRGERFTAQAIEGVRVRAGFDAAADLKLVAGHRIHGTAIDARTHKPLVAAPIRCYSTARPGSGTAWHPTSTDVQGHFEFFVPAGPARVLIANPGLVGHLHEATVIVPADRDPEPIRLAIDDNPPAALTRPLRAFRCEVRMRLPTDPDEGPPPGESRTLSGRVFDSDGSPLVGFRMYCVAGQRLVDCSTDRLGVFRLKGLPPGKLHIHIRKYDKLFGIAIIPPEAVEVDVRFPKQVERRGMTGY
jgi:protocatechuate 3,4-dioxygenase beta subunit